MRNTNYMRPPDEEEAYKIGDRVEVFCDHEDNAGQRIRDWLKGTIVQFENKLIAVQFRENVYLTDGWMVPDRILWFPLDSVNVRPYVSKKKKSDPLEDFDLDSLNLF